MYPLTNKEILNTKPSSIRVVFEEVLRLQNAGKNIIRLDIGSPNFKAPEFIINAAIENLKNGVYGYSSNWGLLSLRSALSKKYKQRAGIEFDPENEIIVTNGASEAIAIVIASLLNDDEHFLIPTPAWPHYIADCQILGKRHKEIKCGFDDDFKLTPEKLIAAIDDKSRVLMLNSPTNPTGAVYTKAEFTALYDICVENGILVVLDEIYEDINFKFTDTLLNTNVDKQNLIYINGFSKNFGMTGFRIGFLMAEKKLAAQLIKYHQYTNVCGQGFAQQACADFLSDDDAVNSYRAFVLKSLQGSQQVLSEFYEGSTIAMTKPSGAFYSFVKKPDSFKDAESFCMQLLSEKMVSVVPGSAFGAGCEGFYRVSYGSVGAADLQFALGEIESYY